MKPNSRTLIKVWGILLSVFVFGSLTGGAIDAIYRSRANADHRMPSIKDGEAYFQLLDRELKLTPEQAYSIEAVLDETRTEYRRVCAEVRPRYDHLRDGARARMRAVLRPEQQERFDSLVTQENCNCPDQKNTADHSREQEKKN